MRSSVIGCVALVLIGITGCDKSDGAAGQEVAPTAGTPAAKAEPNNVPDKAATDKVDTAHEAKPEVAAQPSYDEEAFQLTLTGPDSGKVGETLSYTIVLSAKNGYKVNAEYPVKFRFAEQAGVTPKKPIVSKEDAKVEKTKVELPAQVVVNQAGKHQVAGKLSFSVCTEERCLIEKRDLALPITAS